MEDYINGKKNLYTSIHEFIEESAEHSNDEIGIESFQKIIDIIRSQQIEGDREGMCQFLEIIKSIGEHHHRDQNFNERVTKILEHYKDQIKQTLSIIEIFHIFENNKKIVLFLLKKGIITISDELYNEMMSKLENNGNRYCHFFIPELENFAGEEKVKFAKNELLDENPNFFNNYETKRQEGENDSYICSLIRQDSVEEFISHVNRYNISPLSEISPSIFETNPFLIDNKNTSLIEYSAFFGSIQIFRYLFMNKVELKPSVWIYAIHSKNADLIHFLESNDVPPPKYKSKEKEENGKEFDNSIKNYELCLIESIKCHHNDIAEYIENNLIDQSKEFISNSEQKEEIISNCIKYHNYSYFKNDAIIEYGFFYLCFYHYDKLVELLLKKKEKAIEEKIIQYPNIRAASEKNEVEVIYYYLSKMQEILNSIDIKIKQISIPSSITSIGECAFSRCSSLTQIAIPSSVTSIGDYAFSGCSSLTQISIPSSVNSIGEYAFFGCSSLTQITIPSSVTSIGNNAFFQCTSLTLISNLSTIETIENHAFSECHALIGITIPSFVALIKEFAFYECSSLTQILIPSSVTEIGDSAFSECSSLTQITIPSSVTKVGVCAFSECSSLTQITIPSYVTSIGEGAFCGCSSLTQIIIPSSVTSIRNYTFERCTSLTAIIIPSSVTSIGNNSFCKCSSLTQITIPSSVTSIGDFAFFQCSSLTQITIPSSINIKNLKINPKIRINNY